MAGVYILNRFFKSSRTKLMRALCSIYGIGLSRANFIISILGLTKHSRLGDLSQYKLELLNFYIRELYKVGPALIKRNNFYLYRVNKGGGYRAKRYQLGLPCNGQRTHTNARTSRFRKGRYVVLKLSIK